MTFVNQWETSNFMPKSVFLPKTDFWQENRLHDKMAVMYTCLEGYISFDVPFYTWTFKFYAQ